MHHRDHWLRRILELDPVTDHCGDLPHLGRLRVPVGLPTLTRTRTVPDLLRA